MNKEIRQLIRSRMYLLKDGVLPKSFEDFFVHEAQFEVLHRLWKEKAVDSSHISGHGWPSEFELQVQTSLDHLREQLRCSCGAWDQLRTVAGPQLTRRSRGRAKKRRAPELSRWASSTIGHRPCR